ncbi:hypothetical protein EAS61_15085 [Bradyrhizobium zhanjiangense]|uniref:Uncharacterized protein n=1 Tax=Bradyrhizobium zhanjiangense TaxID=1325107 RepID=A0A4Q0QQQ8_9BRAD|nr:hypothetical protein EAS61_15085 [Bradyrhizobium zhanjiangense]
MASSRGSADPGSRERRTNSLRSKQAGDKDHIKVFANQDAAEKWFEENDPEDVASEYEVLE